ncbi:hypothetical protein STA3757_31360 [Stanieria sp. NIES-3757]|nr:hypothetical protein STA3757_31360 [Stanieria sp. NIES-3757]
MTELDPNLRKQVKRLHQLTVYARWSLVVFSWLTLGTFGLWGLRAEIQRLLDYFTWAGLRYSLSYNLGSSLCLSVCIGLTVSVLVWQSRNIIWGLPLRERYRLQQQVKEILASGTSHPLWKWINK